MATPNNKLKGKVTEDNLTDCLQSLGYLYPSNEFHLTCFDRMYEDYDFKLKDAKIDFTSIMNNSICSKTKLISIRNDEFSTGLKMVARKGSGTIPDYIIQRMQKNQSKKND
jgi:hypothetical protein